MDDENKLRDDLELWATNSEEGGWNIASTDEGSQKMLEDESEKQIKIQTGSDVVDDYFYSEETTDDERMIRVKRGKKTRTVLTNDLKEKPKLAKKVLLGIDNNVVS